MRLATAFTIGALFGLAVHPRRTQRPGQVIYPRPVIDVIAVERFVAGELARIRDSVRAGR